MFLFVFISILFILFSLLGSKLFPTVRTRSTTIKVLWRRERRVYLSTERVCLPANDRPIDRPTVRLRTLAPYCYLNSPFWQTLSHVYCEERNRLILRLVLDTGCDERPQLILSCTSFENEITRTTDAGITLLLTTDRADMHTIYILDNSSADTPATTTWLQLCRYAYSPTDRTIVPLRLRSTTSACIVLLQQTTVLPCHSRRDNDRASMPTITRPIDSPSSMLDHYCYRR